MNEQLDTIKENYSKGRKVDDHDVAYLIGTVDALQKLADTRLESNQAKAAFLDSVAEALGVPKPQTPMEGVGACLGIMTAINLRDSQIERLQEEARRFYREDGTFELLATKRDATNARIVSAIRIEETENVLREANDYLNTNHLTNITHGSILHQKIKDAIGDEPATTCLWSPTDDDAMPGTFETACGHIHSFTEGGPTYNNHRYCPYCGMRLAVAK